MSKPKTDPVPLNEYGQPLRIHRPLTWRKKRPNRNGSLKANNPDSFVFRPQMNRRGVPDGWAGLKEEVSTIRDVAEEQAEGIIRTAAETGAIPCDLMAAPETAEGMAAAALQQAMAFVLDPTKTARVRTESARIVLDYTAAKPSAAFVAAVSAAEEILSSLATRAREVSAKSTT